MLCVISDIWSNILRNAQVCRRETRERRKGGLKDMEYLRTSSSFVSFLGHNQQVIGSLAWGKQAYNALQSLSGCLQFKDSKLSGHHYSGKLVIGVRKKSSSWRSPGGIIRLQSAAKDYFRNPAAVLSSRNRDDLMVPLWSGIVAICTFDRP